jgi:hypothetical protein
VPEIPKKLPTIRTLKEIRTPSHGGLIIDYFIIKNQIFSEKQSYFVFCLSFLLFVVKCRHGDDAGEFSGY